MSILTPPAPQSLNNLILALPKYSNVLPLYQTARKHLSEILSAFEFFDKEAYNLALKHGHLAPFAEGEVDDAQAFVLIETGGGNGDHDSEKLNTLLETLMENEDDPLILNGILSQSPSQFASLWAIREGLTEAIGKEGKAYKYDISIPLSTFNDVLNRTRARCEERGLVKDGLVRGVVGFGHVGDGEFISIPSRMNGRATDRCIGNLHLNVIASEYNQRVTDALEPFVYEQVGEYPFLFPLHPLISLAHLSNHQPNTEAQYQPNTESDQ